MQILAPEFVHADNRRSLKQLLTENIKQINHYEAAKGSILGNHYHKKTSEYFYIVKGSILYNNLKILNRNTLFLVEPGEMHTIKCLTEVNMLTFLTKPYTHDDPDIFKEKK